MAEPPKVGEMFLLYPHNKVAFSNTPYFHTSLVTEVISATEFRTLNSLYKIEVIQKDQVGGYTCVLLLEGYQLSH